MFPLVFSSLQTIGWISFVGIPFASEKGHRTGLLCTSLAPQAYAFGFRWTRVQQARRKQRRSRASSSLRACAQAFDEVDDEEAFCVAEAAALFMLVLAKVAVYA